LGRYRIFDMKTLKPFEYLNPATVEEASAALDRGNAALIAGGSDLLGTLRFEVLPSYPLTVVNLKNIPGLNYIREEAGMLKIGALTKLEDISGSGLIRDKYTALALAASRVGTPHIRAMGTLGGNVCQLTRCWYFRKEDNRFHCLRKGGKTCFAITGDNRYHSIFGAVSSCIAVNPSDTAPALVALRSKIKTNRRVIDAESFWDMRRPGSTVLEAGEILVEIQIPSHSPGVKSAFIKFALRKAIDFPVVNCAAAIGEGTATICLNALYNKPYRAKKAEQAVAGKLIDAASAEAAGAAAIADAIVLPGDRNKWKIPIAQAMVKRAILACS
jgi:xanthine dehydrogenase YagS FAD-binding subunit